MNYQVVKSGGPWTSIKKGLNNPSWRGRSRRSEYWWSTLCLALTTMVISALKPLVPIPVLIFLNLVGYFIVYETYALMSRRLHDIGLSGKLSLSYLISIGLFYMSKEFFPELQQILAAITLSVLAVLITLCCLDGKKEENKYGKSPKYFINNQEINDMNEDNIPQEQKEEITTTGCLLTSLGGFGCLLQFLIPIIIGIVAAYFLCNIDPEESYCWYHGIWHGIFIIPNWIRSWFDSDVYCKAPIATTGYVIWWWIMLIGIITSGGSSRRD